MERMSTQFVDTSGIKTLPKKGELCETVEFSCNISNPLKFLNEKLKCPVETRKILRGIAESDENIQNAFDSCCFLYQLGLNAGRQYPTVKISYMCAAVEAIVKSKATECESFSEFMKKHSSSEGTELYNFIYDIRSSHWHSGQFKMRDHNYEPMDISDSSRLIHTNVRMLAELSMRGAIIDWLFTTLGMTDPLKNNTQSSSPT